MLMKICTYIFFSTKLQNPFHRINENKRFVTTREKRGYKKKKWVEGAAENPLYGIWDRMPTMERKLIATFNKDKNTFFRRKAQGQR
jgi:hypothetical protein